MPLSVDSTTKDYQQLAVIRQMVADPDVPVQILSVPTVRESDGLAMSSRNRRLTLAERAAAPVLKHSLDRAAEMVADGASLSNVRTELRRIIETEPWPISAPSSSATRAICRASPPSSARW